MKRIGLFYGAFDPITNIDIKRALSALKALKLHHIEFVITPGKDYEHRYRMVSLATNSYRRLMIFDRDDKDVEYVDLKLDSVGLTKDSFRELNIKVARYCQDNCLYIEAILARILSKQRHIHILSTATLCRDLAEHYKIDKNRAYLAGLLHDATKELTKDEQKRLMQIYYRDRLATNAKTWHQYTAAIKAKQDFMISDKAIINAIANHVNGTHNGLLSKIVYCSDKIEDTREFDNKELKKLCFDDIDKAVEEIKVEQLRYINGGK